MKRIQKKPTNISTLYKLWSNNNEGFTKFILKNGAILFSTSVYLCNYLQ